MLIAQITDLHCKAVGRGANLGCDNNKNIAQAISRLNNLSSRPDVVLATGDLTTSGTPEQYEVLADLLEPLEVPLYMIPGNHDELGPLLDAFSGKYGLVDQGHDFVRIVIEEYELRLVSLDTTVPEHHNGAIPQERALWLDQVLSEKPNKPTLIFMHHPPFDTGIWWMDRIGVLDGLDRFAEVLSKHSQVVGITAGHLHRTIHATFAGVPVTVAPTTCYSVELNVDVESPAMVTDEPPGLMMHLWRSNTLVSHNLYLKKHNTYNVAPLVKDWPDRWKLMQNKEQVPKVLGAIGDISDDI
ncbi:MAG: phosphodiesterase [Magnetovibrio sp.]|nr:phosphodiesterase [Magnetovibrio sp.]|tara:strand:+ start:659 stop:1555 length:897 start_codon:yes stop_codon:yes gene_type:complete